MIFTKIDGSKIDLETYISSYMKDHPGIDIMVGCDSQNRRKKTSYAAVVALYNPGHGAHVIFRRWNTPKEHVRSSRLLNEVWSSVEIAEAIRTTGYKPKYIDIDINPDPRYRSHEVFNQATGMVEGMGYEVRFKTLGPLVTSMADHLARS